MRPILYVGSHAYDIAPLRTIAGSARRRLGVDAVFATTAPREVAMEVREQLASDGCRLLDRPLVVPARRSMRNPVARARRWRDENRATVDALLSELRPAAVISTVNPPPSLLLDGLARAGVPTVLLQLWFWGDRAFQESWRADDRRVREATQPWPRRLEARLGARIDAAFGLGPHIVWNVRHAQVAVQGPALRRQLVNDGVPAGNVVVTGNPVLDEIHDLRRAPEDAIRRVRAQLGLGSERIITHFRSHEDRMVTVDATTGRTAQAEIVASIREGAPDATIVVKIHPKEGRAERDLIGSIDPAVVVAGTEVDTAGLIATSALTVGTFSTTLLQSVALDRPTISAVLWPGLEYWRRATSWSGVERVESTADLRDAVHRNLEDAAHQSDWSARREAFRRDQFRLDGRGTERIVDLVAQRIESGAPT